MAAVGQGPIAPKHGVAEGGGRVENTRKGAGRRPHGFHFVVKLIDPRTRGEDGRPAVTLASVFADHMGDAIARAMVRYPGQIAVHGERH